MLPGMPKTLIEHIIMEAWVNTLVMMMIIIILMAVVFVWTTKDSPGYSKPEEIEG
jgi:hypothetical protein